MVKSSYLVAYMILVIPGMAEGDSGCEWVIG